MGESYVIVQWRKDGTWFAGRNADVPKWRRLKQSAMKFESIRAFREYERTKIRFGGIFPWLPSQLRFIRVAPRRPS